MPKSHEVPQTAAGFLFQPVRAIRWLAAAPDGAVVGVEYLDDVSLTSPDGEEVFEQNKFSGRQVPPLSNRNVELWKTIGIWAEAANSRSDQLDQGKLSFVLATNRPIRPTWIIYDVAEANDDAAAAAVVERLRSLRTKSREVQRHIEKVLSYPTELLVSLVRRISVENLSNTSTELEYLGGLPIPAGVDQTELFRGLLGWTCSCVFSAWRKKLPALIEKRHFSTYYISLIDRLRPDTRERPTSEVYRAIEPQELAAQNDEVRYVKQLFIIEMANEAENAKMALLAESREKLRLFMEGDVPKQDVDDRDQRLYRAWQIIRQKAELRPASAVSQGKEVYLECMREKAAYRTFIPAESYMTEGAYHRLANLKPDESPLALGWHPDFEGLLDD